MPRSAPPSEPYDLLADARKTTLSCPGGDVLGFGPGPGLAQCLAWNRIGSLFSCYRPSVARLAVFELAGAAARPLPAVAGRAVWHPNHACAEYAAGPLRIAEDRYAEPGGLVCRLRLSLAPRVRRAREFVLSFHGQVEQWPFFDYPAHEVAPPVRCAVHPAQRCVTLTQPHPHPGLPPGEDGQPPATVQRVSVDRPLASYGFGLSEADLRTLQCDHGPLASLRLRLGQVGARYGPAGAAEFAHRQPLYYFTVRLALEPGQEEAVVVACRFSVGPGRAPALPAPAAVTRTLAADKRNWQRYLSREVPQLECSDPALTRYWYYVWHVLRANRCAPGAHIRHPWTAPSKYMYWGPWIWDGYFHVLGEMWLAEAQTALDSIRAVLDMQFPSGFLPVCSGADYRMCFHDKVEGYAPPDGRGGYASYVPPELAEYKEGKHPCEAALTTMAPQGAPAPAARRAPPPRVEVVTAADAAGIRQAVARLGSRKEPAALNGVIIEGLDRLAAFDSATLGQLVTLVKLAGQAGRVVFVMPDNAFRRRLLQAIRLDKYLPVCPTRADALAYLSSPPEPGPASASRKSVRATAKFTHNEKTQTPLITLAAADLLRLRGAELPGGRRAAARELLPPLWAYEQWLWRRRTDRQGRFVLWHGDESGWDDATRHYPVPARPYDVQVHCLLHRAALREVMLAAGELEHLAELDRRIAKTRRALDSYWHAGDQWIYDLDGPAGAGAGRPPLPEPHRRQIAASGLFGLLADTRPHTVDACLFALGHPRVFAAPNPIPSLARCDPDYAPHGWGWNGPVWLQVNFFALTGLLRAARAGRADALPAAWRLWEQTRALVIRDGAPHSYELYDPETGTGLGCPDYSWQAMLLHLLIHEFAGVPVGAELARPGKDDPAERPRTLPGNVPSGAGQASPAPAVLLSPALPPGLDRLRLSNLPGGVSAIALERRRGELFIDVRLARPGIPVLDAGCCGHIVHVDARAGRTLRAAPLALQAGLWRPNTLLRPSRHWRLQLSGPPPTGDSS